MLAGGLASGPTIRVIIKGERFAGRSRRTVKRVGMPMVGKICGAEDDASPKDGQNLLATLGHVAVP